MGKSVKNMNKEAKEKLKKFLLVDGFVTGKEGPHVRDGNKKSSSDDNLNDEVAEKK